MKRIKKFNQIPAGSIIAKNFNDKYDYVDSFSIEINNTDKYSIDYITALCFTYFPGWVNFLIKMRDIIVKPFGLETGLIPVPEVIDQSIHFNVGEKAIFFNVIDRSESEIVMSENDKHLLFKTSLFTRQTAESTIESVFLTTIVKYHNNYGKIYFAFVKPFHRIIMKRLLLNFAKRISSSSKWTD